MTAFRPLHICLLVAALLCPGVRAAEAASVSARPSTTVKATGRATVYGEDVSGARDRAVEAGLLRAVEIYAGLRIESTTLVKKGELIDREIRTRTRGFVKTYDVLESGQEGNELVVDLRVEVSPTPVDEAFRRLVSSTTTLLLVHETSLGKVASGPVLPAILADPFFTAKLVVPPAATLRSATGSVPARFFGEPDPATAKELGLRHMAGLIVVVSATATRLDTAPDSIGYAVDKTVLRPVVAAQGRLSILSGEDGRTIAAQRFDDIRGSDASDVERATTKALTSLAGEMRTFLVARLSEHIAQVGHSLRVTVTGPAAAGGARRIREVMQATRWVRQVEVIEESSGRTVLKASCLEKPFYVLGELRHSPDITVSSFDAQKGEAEVR